MTDVSHNERLADHFPNGGWRKSSYSDPTGNNCVEVLTEPKAVQVRDSKDTTIPACVPRNSAWLEVLAV
ncbi:DUF397 domain-containing protein [Streptomyces sp. NBC_00237]|uniref:DUF397 domain-containing protein n=1 Tax=Streptomyces sp. NBC_00237 TaxID=2975687 RepID=UPI00224F3BAE|nr:DUF397 domain-containing protein [Streptomyces sp. NBC_00237]MCX5206039.1 DUF397 domain-containing protein [Streptomyces sp. NBC_00237]